MQQPPSAESSIFDTPEDAAARGAGQEPQIRQRERSGILGEPAGVPPGAAGNSDGTERDDPIQEQVPEGDHWRG